MALRCLAWLGSTQLVSERQRSHNKNRNIWHTGTHTRAHTRTHDPEVELSTPPPPVPTLFFSNNVEQQTVQRLVWFSVGIINWAQTALLSGCTRESALSQPKQHTERAPRVHTRERRCKRARRHTQTHRRVYTWYLHEITRAAWEQSKSWRGEWPKTAKRAQKVRESAIIILKLKCIF